MLILVDGHNVIGRWPAVSLDDPDDEVRLVERLRAYRAHTGHRVVVFFDQGVPAGWDRTISTPGVQVVFARPGVPADRLIVARLRRVRDRQGVMVVSDDAEVVRAARRYGVRWIGAGQFVKALEDVGCVEREEGDVMLSPEEVEMWLRLFEERGGDERDGEG